MQLFYALICFLLLISTALLKFFSRTRDVIAETAISFFREDDSDIKIAGMEPKTDDDNEAKTEAIELQRQRENGNIAKAAEVSKVLCRKFIAADGVSPFGNDSEETPEVKTERRLLLAFTVVTTTEKIVSSTILRDIIVNKFYDDLKTAIPDFYEEFKKSGSFSFYTLCIRRGSETEKLIGETFAMLCSKEGDPVYSEFGSALYLGFIDIIKETVKSFDFK
jgi:hypothetical protein